MKKPTKKPKPLIIVWQAGTYVNITQALAEGREIIICGAGGGGGRL